MYHIRKAKGKSDGLGGIYCRITVDGTRAEMSISRKVPIDKWDAIVGKVRGVSAIAQEINELMRSVENAILDKQREFIKRGVSFTATDLRDAYLGKKQDYKKILDLFREHNDKIYRLIMYRLIKVSIEFNSLIFAVNLKLQEHYHSRL